MEFEDALRLLKSGNKITNDNWNGKDMFLYHVPSNSYPAQTDVAKEEFGDMVEYGAYIAMKTADGTVIPWLASQMDMFSNKWRMV